MFFAVVIIIGGECPEKVAAAVDSGGEDVTVFGTRDGGGEEAESLLLLEREMKGFGNDRGGATGEVTVGKPSSLEVVSEGGGATAVNVVGNVCNNNSKSK